MKLHPVLLRAAISALRAIFTTDRYADKIIEQTLRSQPKWGARDRAFIAETVYDLVRYWRRYWALMRREPGTEEWQLWHLFGLYWQAKGNQLPDWVEFKGVPKYYENNLELLPLLDQLSYPDWIWEQMVAELGPEISARELDAMNNQAEVVLRVNTLKASVLEVRKQLAEEQILTDLLPDYPYALRLRERQNIFRSPLFQSGAIEMQDANSQRIAPFTQVEPGMRVVDACAGAGGKSMHLGSLMQNKGRLISLDLSEPKLTELRQRARRNGITLIETKPIESTKTIKRLKESADVVLLDVPCSGWGVFRRNPDSKWKLSPDFLDKVRQSQASILGSYAQMTKKGGTLVYATCSILPSENQRQVEKFLSEHPDYVLDAEQTLLPSVTGFDGFYMARMKRK